MRSLNISANKSRLQKRKGNKYISGLAHVRITNKLGNTTFGIRYCEEYLLQYVASDHAKNGRSELFCFGRKFSKYHIVVCEASQSQVFSMVVFWLSILVNVLYKHSYFLPTAIIKCYMSVHRLIPECKKRWEPASFLAMLSVEPSMDKSKRGSYWNTLSL